MTKGGCPDIDELARLIDLAAGDPRREHLDDCPRCRAQAMVLREFLQDPAVPAGAAVDNASERLLRSLQAEQDAEQGRARSRPFPAIPGARLFRPRRWPFLVSLRPVAAVVALAALGSALYFGWIRRSPGDEADVLRSTPGPALSDRPGASNPSATEDAWLLPVGTDPDGSPVLRWRARPGADAYVVHLFSAELSDIARFGPRPDTMLVLSRAATAAHPLPAGELGWQVSVLRAGQIFETSPVATVRIH